MITVAMTVCERPEYLTRTLETWRDVRGAEDCRWIFAVEPTPVVELQVRLIREFIDVIHPAESSITVHGRKKGVLENPFWALTVGFGESDYVVLAEEDLMVSEDILEMHRFAAREFRANRVLGVCSHTRLNGAPETLLVDPGPVFSPWVWGTWRDRWLDTIKPTWDHDYSTHNGHPGEQAGWDWNLNTRVAPAGGWAWVVPGVSRVQNIGEHGGVHALPADYPSTIVPWWRKEMPRLRYQPVR